MPRVADADALIVQGSASGAFGGSASSLSFSGYGFQQPVSRSDTVKFGSFQASGGLNNFLTMPGTFQLQVAFSISSGSLPAAGGDFVASVDGTIARNELGQFILSFGSHPHVFAFGHAGLLSLELPDLEVGSDADSALMGHWSLNSSPVAVPEVAAGWFLLLIGSGSLFAINKRWNVA